MSAEYSFPEECGLFNGTKEELFMFASIVQKQGILGKSLVSFGNKIISYSPTMAEDEARLARYYESCDKNSP